MSRGDASKAWVEELPHYRVRRSKRARYLQLKVSHLAEVELVVPVHCDLHAAEAFVRQHRDWLQRTLQQVRAQRAARPELDAVLPETVELPAIGERWRVDYGPAARRYGERFHAGRRVVVREQAQTQMRAALCDWLSSRARRRLLPWLRELSRELDLPYRSASIRAQKTRWGSCSAQRNISLNRNLLFVEPAAARYLLVHELCHTAHLNHSRRYWALVERHCPEYRVCEQILRDAARCIPAWAFP